MKKNLLLVLVYVIVQQLAAEWISTSNASELFTSISESTSRTILQFSLDGYDSDVLMENGEQYHKISYQNEGKFLEVGKPDLPRFSRLILFLIHSAVR